MSKKVIIVGSAYPLRGGGITTFNERLARAFQEAGNEVVIFTFSLQYPSFLFPGTTQYSEEEPPQGLDIRVTVNSINPISWHITANKIAAENPDIVVIRYWLPFMAPCLGTIARFVRKRTKAKVISITDNIIPHERRIGDNALSRYFVRSVDGFVAMSRSVLQDLNLFDTKKPRQYYPHPLYDNFGERIAKAEAIEKLSIDSSYSYMLFFGFIRDYKGLDLLLEALTSKRIQGLKVKLIIAGEFYGNEEKYMTYIRENDLEPYIELKTSFIPNSEVYLYFCASSLVVQPYKNATQSGVTQIAYHFGVPMITTNVGGLSEMVPDNVVGFVVEPNPSSIEEAIFRYFSENREEAFSNNIIKERERFSWSGLTETIENISDLTNVK